MILQGFEDYLKESRIVPERNRPWCVRWVERFLKSPVCQRGDLCEEDRVRLFVEQLGSDRRWKDWQIDQADKSVRLYLFTFSRDQAEEAAWGTQALHGEGGLQQGVYDEALQAMRESLRLRHYSYRTEQTYLEWAQKYFRYASECRLEPRASETVRKYLAHLAMEQRVSASTQNQAFSALPFLFRQAWSQQLGDLSKGAGPRTGASCLRTLEPTRSAGTTFPTAPYRTW